MMHSLRVSVVGVGSLTYLSQFCKKDEETIKENLRKIAKILADYDVELICLTGIEILLAKEFKIFGGSTVIAPLPIEDKIIGIKHLQQYIEMDVKRFPLFDGFIDTSDWFKTDFIRPLLGDVLVLLGYSPGTLLELNAGLYMYKILQGKKSNTFLSIDDPLRKHLRAGTKFPFEVWIYKPFVSGRLPREIEEYCKKIGVKLIYIKNPDDLRRNLERIEKLINKKVV